MWRVAAASMSMGEQHTRPRRHVAGPAACCQRMAASWLGLSYDDGPPAALPAPCKAPPAAAALAAAVFLSCGDRASQ